MGIWIVLGIIGIVALICLWGCSYFQETGKALLAIVAGECGFGVIMAGTVILLVLSTL